MVEGTEDLSGVGEVGGWGLFLVTDGLNSDSYRGREDFIRYNRPRYGSESESDEALLASPVLSVRMDARLIVRVSGGASLLS